MIQQLLRHIRANAVAYVALFFAIGGGGGYAIAATTSAKTIHACVSKRTGALYIAKRCSRSTRTLVFDQQGPRGLTGLPGAAGPAGTSAVVAYGEVGDNGGNGSGQGLTITQVSTGVYDVTVTACASNTQPFAVVSPYGDGPVNTSTSANQVPVAWVDPGGGSSVNSVVVHAGTLTNGSYVATTQGFQIFAQCHQ